MKQRLLKRIRGWEESGVVSASDIDVNEIMESIRDDLEKLLNTRRGTVLVDDDFGLPDFTHLVNGYAAPDIDDLRRDLLRQVRDYEPRLSAVEVVYQEPGRRATGIRFSLSGSFQHKDQDMILATTLQINDNGSVNVAL